MKPRLAIVETHPIQYKAPLFRLMAQRDDVKTMVYYAMIPDSTQQGAGFGVSFAWDVPLLEGYPYTVLKNRAVNPSVIRFDGCDTPNIYDHLRRDRPDAVLVNGWVVKSCIQTLWACRRLGIPCLVRGEANLLRPRAWWKHALHRILLKQYAGWLAIGSANADFYRFHQCASSRIFFAPYAVDNDRFATAALERVGRKEALRGHYKMPASAVVFLFVGKFIDKKRPMDLLDAVQALPSELRARAHLFMVGDGPLLEACRERALADELPATFPGFVNQSELPDVYAASDVLVLPSDAGETWGLVVNEAMASGRPAIVSQQAGSHADLIVAGRTGFSYPCGDVQACADHMASYIRDPEAAAAHGAQAAAHIQAYGLQQTAGGIASAVRAVVGCAK